MCVSERQKSKNETDTIRLVPFSNGRVKPPTFLREVFEMKIPSIIASSDQITSPQVQAMDPSKLNAADKAVFDRLVKVMTSSEETNGDKNNNKENESDRSRATSRQVIPKNNKVTAQKVLPTGKQILSSMGVPENYPEIYELAKAIAKRDKINEDFEVIEVYSMAVKSKQKNYREKASLLLLTSSSSSCSSSSPLPPYYSFVVCALARNFRLARFLLFYSLALCMLSLDLRTRSNISLSRSLALLLAGSVKTFYYLALSTFISNHLLLSSFSSPFSSSAVV